MKRRSAPARGLLRIPVLVLVAAGLGALGVRCRVDTLLDDWSGAQGTENGPRRGAPTPESGHVTAKREQASDRPQPTAKPPRDRNPGGPTPRAPGDPAGTAPSSSSSPNASIHLEMGVPVDDDPSDDLLRTKPQYALSYNPNRNVSNWVSWNLDEGYFGDVPRRRGRFLSDDSLPQGVYRVRDQDYAGSGFDRGHMVRSEERTRTVEDNTATFLLTNVLPQRHDLNAGPWLRLEDYCQELSQKGRRKLFITAGGVFTKRPETIGHGVAVPDACFKIVVVLDRGEGAKDVTPKTRVIAVLMPNTTGILDEAWGGYRTTVKEIERQTGYDFLPALPEAIQRAIEGRVDDGPTRETPR